MEINARVFGYLPDNVPVKSFTLINDNDMEMELISYGAIMVSLEVPDRNGNCTDVILGFDSLDDYISDDTYQGATIGRYANRIDGGKFQLDGVEYSLPSNDDGNHLHGGEKGFHNVLWEPEIVRGTDHVSVKFTYYSKDGEEGYPGNLSVEVTYTLSNDNEVKIDFKAESDKTCPVNMTHHSYFNLAGQGTSDILNHELTIFADKFTPVNGNLVPTGEVLPVKQTEMDFTGAGLIGDRIRNKPSGFDHNYILNKNGNRLSKAAILCDPESGRVLELSTTKPAVQFYTGNFLSGQKGKKGRSYNKHYGLCLEPQFYPDSPNHPSFPDPFLEKGETYSHQIIYKFSAR